MNITENRDKINTKRSKRSKKETNTRKDAENVYHILVTLPFDRSSTFKLPKTVVHGSVQTHTCPRAHTQ